MRRRARHWSGWKPTVKTDMVFAEKRKKRLRRPILKNSKVSDRLHTDFRAVAMYSRMKEMAENISGFITGQR